jgi:hypothetical protein
MRHIVLAAWILAFGTVTGDHLSAQDRSRADVVGPLPAPWIYQDIGNVGQPGGALSGGNGDFMIQSAGSDIWDISDSFGYMFRPFAGDGEILSQVVGIQNTDTFAKAGVMLRETLDPQSAHVVLDVRPTGDIEFTPATPPPTGWHGPPSAARRPE